MPEAQHARRHARLSDLISQALNLAVEQGDIEISDKLLATIDVAMTRNAGGGEFVERRSYPAEIEAAIERLNQLKAESQLD